MPETVATQNPYQPLDDTLKGSVECQFDGNVTVSDISYGQCRTRAFATLTLVPLILFAFWMGARVLQQGASDSGGIITTAGAVLAFILYRIWRVPQRFARANPHLMGRRKGRLTTNFVEVQTETTFHRMRSDCIRVHAVRNEWITLRVVADLLLVRNLFSDFAKAREMAAEIKQDAKPLEFGDDRLLEPVPDIFDESPVAAIPLSGQQLSSDFHIAEMAQEASKLRMFVVRKLIFTVAVNAFLLLSTRNLLIASPCLVMSLFWFYSRILTPVRRSLKAAFMVRDGQDRPVSQIRGWVTDSELHFRSAVSHSTYQWEAFERYRMKDEQTVVLIKERNVLMCSINRRLLASDGDWTRLVSFVREKLPETT